MMKSPSTRFAGGVDGEHAVAVAVEGQAEVEAVAGHDLLQRADVRAAAAGVDVGAVGLGEEHGDVGARLRERQRRGPVTWRRGRSRGRSSCR